MFEIDITFTINTLTVLSIQMNILYFRCLMVKVLMLGLKDLTLLLPPCRTLTDVKSGSDMKFCSEMLWKLCRRGKEKQDKETTSRLCILDFKSKVEQLWAKAPLKKDWHKLVKWPLPGVVWMWSVNSRKAEVLYGSLMSFMERASMKLEMN